MNKNVPHSISSLWLCLATFTLLFSSGVLAQNTSTPMETAPIAPVSPDGRGPPVELEREGSFFVGGTIVTSPQGDTFHGDNAYVKFQIPPAARALPIVMWHGGGQFSKQWESTPDGRDGYQQIFTRRRFSVYLVDQPRRAGGGNTTVGTTIPDAVPNDSLFFGLFRLGVWQPPGSPQFFRNTQFPREQASIDQFFSQLTPNTGPENIDPETRNLQASAVVSLFNKIGPGVLLTHSNSGQYGWTAAMKASDRIKTIVAYEPSAFAFPSNEVPADIPTSFPMIAAVAAPQLYSATEFQNLTKMPIQIIFGDNIEFATPSAIFGVEAWRVIVQRAAQFVSAVNRHGGHAEMIFLPQYGLFGNTHFAFSDLNNVQVADLLSAYLSHNGFDKPGRPGDW